MLHEQLSLLPHANIYKKRDTSKNFQSFHLKGNCQQSRRHCLRLDPKDQNNSNSLESVHIEGARLSRNKFRFAHLA